MLRRDANAGCRGTNYRPRPHVRAPIARRSANCGYRQDGSAGRIPEGPLRCLSPSTPSGPDPDAAGPQHSEAEHKPQASSPSKSARISSFITSLFPFWVTLFALMAIIWPSSFTWMPQKYITGALAFVMLGMGLTLTFNDFGNVIKRSPQLLLLGLILQYTVMPALGFALSRHANLPVGLATGIVVVSCCPGGTASNIVAYIAKAEMGLSIMMTTISTLAAVVATPLLTSWLVGTLMPVNPAALFMSTAQVVLAPVVVGALANRLFPQTVARIAVFTPAAATVVVSGVVGCTLAHSAAAVRATGPLLVGTVALLHALGFVAGYGVSAALRLSPKICRTNSIEVGMQNATLGAVLATLHFSGDPLVAAPCAVSSCVQCFLGAALASYWSRTVVD